MRLNQYIGAELIVIEMIIFPVVDEMIAMREDEERHYQLRICLLLFL